MMKWSKKEERFLQRFYPNSPNRLISMVLGRSPMSVNHKANRLSIWKSDFVNPTKLQDRSGSKLSFAAARARYGS